MVTQLLHTLAIILKSPIIPSEEVDNPLLEYLNTSVFQSLSHPWAEWMVQSKYGRKDSSKKSLLQVLLFLPFLSNSGMKFRKKGQITASLFNYNLHYYKRWQDSHLTSNRASS